MNLYYFAMLYRTLYYLQYIPIFYIEYYIPTFFLNEINYKFQTIILGQKTSKCSI